MNAGILPRSADVFVNNPMYVGVMLAVLSQARCLNPPQNPRRQSDDRPHQFQHPAHRDAHDPEGQQQQPDQRIQEQRHQGQRPTEEQHHAPHQKGQHSTSPRSAASASSTSSNSGMISPIRVISRISRTRALASARNSCPPRLASDLWSSTIKARPVESIYGTALKSTTALAIPISCKDFRADISAASDPVTNRPWRRRIQTPSRISDSKRIHTPPTHAPSGSALSQSNRYRSEERRVGKECRSRWSPY